MKHTRVCRLCNKEKNIDSFYLRLDTNTYRTECRSCQTGKRTERARKIGSNEHIRVLLRDARYRAKKRNIKFTLTKEELKKLVTDTCPILGMKLKIGIDNWQNSPSLDRIDNDKGYIKGNVIMVSHMANSIKNQATPDQIQKVATFYKKLYKEKGINYG